MEVPRRLTEGVPGTGGSLRVELEDFLVEEVPLYEPCGTGEHVLFEIEKRGISTREAARRVALRLGVRVEGIGFAGQKDSRSVARQWMSAQHVEPASVMQLDAPGLRVLRAARHRNKLRLGHLAANRFTIRVRGPRPGSSGDARAVLETLARKGVPNRFGAQRFGERSDGHLVGAALLRGDWDEVVSLLLGRPSELDPPRVRASREAFERGALAEALRLLPPERSDERACLAALLAGRSRERALGAIPGRSRRFLVSALQSQLFNRVLDSRMPDIDRLERGDLAYKHDSGAVFMVTDPAAESPRAERFEVSPSGPLFGYKMIEPAFGPAELERRVLAEAGLSAADFGRWPALKLKGERRPLRVRLSDYSLEEREGDLVLAFTLPPGSYATVVLDEVMKSDSVP